MTVSTIGSSAQLGLAMRFVVEVDGYSLGSWTTCKGLDVRFKHDAVRELGEHGSTTWIPGRPDYTPVTLQRAMKSGDWACTKRWLDSVMADERFHRGDHGGAATIRLLDAALGEVAEWTLRNVLPSAWKGPQLDANAQKVALETLELVHEGFLDG